ncbi:MAG TPA: colicin immunity domain-containing protein [Nitrososphaeraceae archaeon]|jgi:hypothetical protein
MEPFLELMEQYLAGEIQGAEFQNRFFEEFKKDNAVWLDKNHRILNWLFNEVEAYCSDPELLKRLDPKFNIGEKELRMAVKRGLTELKSLE